ncbi:class A beta-lactamase [Novosphingobium sp. 1949]|uniref:beta-lactamase n=1 Tax=Novosphingobium organovorum TaxID=2930092 RepID=A0ABT0BA47_9SPHN|nr:class A beta-lactamase [Novosphingobium organovorum]MCJ2181728.1 class A beta-lactamase [Novosphingobium organovorum]
MIGLGGLAGSVAPPLLATSQRDPSAALAALEGRAKGRLGAFVLDTASGHSFGWRANERFTQCSSFKLSLGAMLLARGDAGTLDLSHRLRWTKADLLDYSPVTSQHVAQGMTLFNLARAAVVTSDNTAANLLLHASGGPQALTRFWRAIGDTVSRLDRFEPELNRTPPGTELDTTSPAAMGQTLRTLLLGTALSSASRRTLTAWMTAVETGTDRLRAGFPKDWVSGDKTGTGATTYIDLAFGAPVGKAPLLVTAYFEPAVRRPLIDPAATAVLAEVARIAVRFTKA